MDQSSSGKNSKSQVRFSIGTYNDKYKTDINKVSKKASAFNKAVSVFLGKSDIGNNLDGEKIPETEQTNSLEITNSKSVTSDYEDKSPAKNRIAVTLNGDSSSRPKIIVEKPEKPPNSNETSIDENSLKNREFLEKPDYPPKLEISSEPSSSASSITGEYVSVVKISSFTGESKRPNRLEFLPQKSNTIKQSPKSTGSSTPQEELQNELVATLKRSNLKKRADLFNAFDEINKTPDETSKSCSKMPNGTNNDCSSLTNGMVKQLASTLNTKLILRTKKSADDDR